MRLKNPVKAVAENKGAEGCIRHGFIKSPGKNGSTDIGNRDGQVSLKRILWREYDIEFL